MARLPELLVEMRALEDDELETKLAEAKEELFNLRFQSATRQLESHGRLNAVRKDIARIYTVMRERELGIGHERELDAGPDAEQAASVSDTVPDTESASA